MGRSIYFTDLEIEKLIDYVSNHVLSASPNSSTELDT